MKRKRIFASLLCIAVIFNLTACSANNNVDEVTNDETQTIAASSENTDAVSTDAASTDVAGAEEGSTPKYVFLFIGDGMSYPQFQAASDYLGAMADEDYMGALPSLSYDDRTSTLDGPVELNFMDFEVAGSTSYETITEKVHEQLGWKVGIISSVNLNHATPAAFYAHQASRNDYYEIGLELVESDFEYFAGGGLKKPTGNEGDQESSYDLATAVGYKVTYTQDEANAVTAADGKVVLIDEHLEDSDAMKYEIDREDSEWALADYVTKGIEVLDNEEGFFMMCEGGKIDWACHANDATSTVLDTLAFADAVQVAIDFAKEHPEETLILVTGDHETGGLTIGFAGTDYDTYLTNLSNQNISFQQFDDEYIAAYKENGTSFEDAMLDVEKLFGLKMTGEEDDKLVLTEYEIERLKTAYEVAVSEEEVEYDQEQYVLYGTYNPFSVTITHILNNKSGIDFTSYSHTGLPVGVFADGVGAEEFSGYYDNTDIYNKVAALIGVN